MPRYGDMVAGLTSALGIRPCADCKRRQAALNRLGARKPCGGCGGKDRVAGRVGDDVSVSVTDDQLASAGLDVAGVSPADRAAAAQVYTDAAAGIAAAKAGGTLNALSAAGAGVGTLATMIGGPYAPAFAAVAAIWAGSLQGIKWLGDHFGWAHGGLGVWTEWANAFPPQGTGTQADGSVDGDGNYWEPVNGYRPGARTPWTDGKLRQAAGADIAHGFGPMAPRIQTTFDRFAVPTLYRVAEQAMNGRARDQYGEALLYSEALSQAFTKLLALWNSQNPPAAGMFAAVDQQTTTPGDWSTNWALGYPEQFTLNKATPMGYRGGLALLSPAVAPKSLSKNGRSLLLGITSGMGGTAAQKKAVLSTLAQTIPTAHRALTPQETAVRAFVLKYTGKDWQPA